MRCPGWRCSRKPTWCRFRYHGDRHRLIASAAAALDDHGRLDPARLGEPCLYIAAAFVRNVARVPRRHVGRPISSITQIQSAPMIPRLARLAAGGRPARPLDQRAYRRCVAAAETAQQRSAGGARGSSPRRQLWCPIPAHLHDRDIRIWHLPTICMHRAPPLLRVHHHRAVLEPDTARATAALGIDWSRPPWPLPPRSPNVAASRLPTPAPTCRHPPRGLGERAAGAAANRRGSVPGRQDRPWLTRPRLRP